MDNSAKDNKNIHVHAFCSELVKLGIFETVEVNFLMVGHTHEDIDALFSKPIGFRFSMTNNVPIYKFQAKVDGPWMPEGGHSLWKKRNGQFIFRDEEPRALPLPSTHPRLDEVSPFINNLITFLKDTYYKDETSEGYQKYSPVVSYWERVKANLTRIQPLQEEKLQFGFWPQTNHGTGFMTDAQYEDGLRVEQDEPALDELERELQAENEMQLQPYVGPPSLHPKRAFVPLEDICEGKFVVLRPEDDFEAEVPRAVWLGRVMGAVVRDNNDEHHGQFQIEWWRPRHRKSTNATNKERYTSLLVRQKDWEKNPGYNTPHWINASAAIYSWKYRTKEGVPLITKLNPLAKVAIKSHFEMLDSNEGRD
ncbi:hypothetical protein R1sor_012721 [Riccia sorocarpa]|uniref:DUF7869 domain-containing protein n=1 Tax=Riccia sorocarpa TaxID=122646 RepID=A0ABD3I8D1_9MARC